MWIPYIATVVKQAESDYKRQAIWSSIRPSLSFFIFQLPAHWVFCRLRRKVAWSLKINLYKQEVSWWGIRCRRSPCELQAELRRCVVEACLHPSLARAFDSLRGYNLNCESSLPQCVRANACALWQRINCTLDVTLFLVVANRSITCSMSQKSWQWGGIDCMCMLEEWLDWLLCLDDFIYVNVCY